MNAGAVPVPFAGPQLLEARHVCAFFHDLAVHRLERYRAHPKQRELPSVLLLATASTRPSSEILEMQTGNLPFTVPIRFTQCRTRGVATEQHLR